MTTLELVHEGDLAAVLPEADVLETMAADDRADWALLLMVSCTGIATLALAAASSLLA